MTTTLTVTLTEDRARTTATALAEDPSVAADAVDMNETTAGTWQVVAYFATVSRERHAAAEAALRRGSAGEVSSEWQVLPETDWVALSQAALPPVRAGRVVVYGAHDRDKLRPNDVGLLIEAAQAFGTGHHGTTRGCLLAIQWLAKSRRIRSALDVGTGSGVLAIALARQGTRVVATEIDPVAAVIARDNARSNGVAGWIDVRLMPVQRGTLPWRRHNQRYDLVVANILMGPLLALAPAIAEAAASGGSVVLSGLLPQQRAPILATYRFLGLRLRRWFVLDGWLTVIFDRAVAPIGNAGALRLSGRLR